MSTNEPPAETPTGPSGLRNFFDSLRRSPVVRSDDRWAGGVCAGLAERLGVDVTVVRVVLLVTGLLSGLPLIAYGAAWLLLPDRRGRIETESALDGDVSGGSVVALLLVLFSGVLPRPWHGFWPGDVWAGQPWGEQLAGLLVVAAVVVVLVIALPHWRRQQGGTGSGTGPGGPGGGGHGGPGPDGPWPRSGPGGHSVSGASGGSGGSWDDGGWGTSAASGPTSGPAAGAPGTDPDVPGGAGPTAAAAPATATRPAPAPPRTPAPDPTPRRKGPGTVLTSAVLGIALVAAGAAGILAAQGTVDVSTSLAAAATATAVLGLVVVALGVAGRTDGTLGFAGLVAGLLTVWFAVVPVTSSLSVGDTDWTPTTVSAAEHGHVLVVGEGRIDLTAVPVRGQDVVVPVRLGVGSMTVTVPDDVPVTVRSRVLAGRAASDDDPLPRGWSSEGRVQGAGADTTLERRGTGPRLVVDLQTLVGDVDVVVVDS